MTQEEKRLALDLVKDSLEAYLTDRTYISPPKTLPELFSKNGASFVTINLKENNTLRGCMGTIVAYRPLSEDLIKNTISSATGDPRFPPMTIEDIKDVSLEISILTEPQCLEFTDSTDLINKVRKDIDGLIIKRGEHQATFLPSVWEQLPSKEEFFMHLCHKAGMEIECFKDKNLQVYTYQAIKIKEES